jgi:hypothetical protein
VSVATLKNCEPFVCADVRVWETTRRRAIIEERSEGQARAPAKVASLGQQKKKKKGAAGRGGGMRKPEKKRELN